MRQQPDIHPMHTASRRETARNQAHAQSRLNMMRDNDCDGDRGRDTDRDGN